MKTQLVLWTAVAAAIFALIVPVASAEMMFDPPWGDPGDPQWAGGTTTHQAFEFDLNPWLPDEATLVNEFADPATGRYPYAATWNANQEMTAGPLGEIVNTWHIDGIIGGIDIYIPNDPRPNDEKLILVQVTSDKAPSSLRTTPGGNVTPYGVAVQHANGFYTYASMIEIPFNPPEEWIRYTFPQSTNISEVVVDTICIPEPATIVSLLSLFAVGIGVLIRRRI